MIKKLLIYIKSDGLYNTFSYLCNALKQKIYKKSITRFYVLSNEANQIKTKIVDSDIIKVNKDTISDINFPRLLQTDYRSWLDHGSELYVTYKNNQPVAYTWTHYNKYVIHGAGVFEMNDKECWIGPTYVLNKFRGQGLNKIQILNQISKTKSSCFYTSVNVKNIPSSKSFEKIGFKCIGEICTVYKWGTRRSYISGSDIFKRKIKL